MFQIDTGQARTDLYGIGKGLAQVVDLSPLREAAAQEAQRNFVEKQAEEKRKADMEANIYDQVAKLDSKVFFRDRPEFIKRQQEIVDYAKNNIQKLRNNDANALLDFSSMIESFNRDAALSKAAGDQWATQKLLVEKEKQNGKTFRQGSLQQLDDFVSEKNIGNFNTSNLAPVENINYMERVTGKLMPYAEKAARVTPYGKTFTKQEAEQTIEDDLLSDPNLLAQANEDYEKATNKLGTTDGITYFKKKYSPHLTINDTSLPPEWAVTGAGVKDRGVTTITVTQTDDGEQIHMMNPTTNEELLVNKDKEGNVTGGNLNTKLTTNQKAANDKVRTENQKAQALYNQQLRDAQMFRATMPKFEKEEEKNAFMAQLQAMIPKPVKLKPLPYPEQNIKLDANEAFRLAHDKHKVNITDYNASPNKVVVQTVGQKTQSITPDEFNAQWAKLKPGQKLVAPDGKTYTKK